MRVQVVQNSPSFKSGYPTFGTAGHLSIKHNPSWDVYIGFKPVPDIKRGGLLNYYA